MGKHVDLALTLLIVIIGMFIPFFGALVLAFGLDFTNIKDIMKIASTFGYFLLIFGIELVVVFLYYSITGKMASKKMDKYKPK